MMALRPQATDIVKSPFSLLLKALGASLLSLGFVGCLTPSFQLDPVDGVSCENFRIDGDESDIDCGGDHCDPCKLGRTCRADIDCQNESCVSGKCAEPSCADDKLNQDETDIDCGGACGANCRVDERCEADDDCDSGSCRAQRCVEASCSDGAQNNGETDEDCGGSLCKGTCEIGLRCKTNSDCLQPDDSAGANRGMAQCVESDLDGELRCELACPVRRGDCDSSAANGCETNTDADLNHCGACGEGCAPENATKAHCEFGVCQVDECKDGYEDCDPDVPGCESNLATDPDHCGSCETDCSDTNGKDSCKEGLCGITCDEGFKDCDAETNPGKNGCETNIFANINNCGDCAADGGKVCEGDPGNNIFPVCLDGDCETVDCSGYDEGMAACDGDGKCNDLLSTTANCGGCGLECLVENGEPECAAADDAYACKVKSCDSNFANCDGNEVDCEVDVRTNARHCGGCTGKGGVDCAALAEDSAKHVVTAACQSRACTIVSCAPGWIDCDGKTENGCEVSVSSTEHCGGCLPSDPVQGSGKDCSAVYPDATSLSCEEGLCEVDCGTGLCPDATGICNVSLGGVQACRTCGEVCTAGEGTFATCSTTNGCQVIYPVQVVQNKSAYNSAGTDAPPLSLTFDLGSGPSRGLVILASTAGSATMTYGSTTITPIASAQVPNHTGYVHVAFINDAALGSAGSKTVTVSSEWGGKVLSILELNNVAQGAARDTNILTGSGCATNITQLTDVSTRGSLVAAALHVQFNGGVSGTPSGSLTELIDQYAPEQLNGMNGYRANVDANVTVGWNVSGSCWNSALITASFNPRVASP